MGPHSCEDWEARPGHGGQPSAWGSPGPSRATGMSSPCLAPGRLPSAESTQPSLQVTAGSGPRPQLAHQGRGREAAQGSSTDGRKGCCSANLCENDSDGTWRLGAHGAGLALRVLPTCHLVQFPCHREVVRSGHRQSCRAGTSPEPVLLSPVSDSEGLGHEALALPRCLVSVDNPCLSAESFGGCDCGPVETTAQWRLPPLCALAPCACACACQVALGKLFHLRPRRFLICKVGRCPG